MKYELIISEYASAPWCILPEKLQALARVISSRALGADDSLDPILNPKSEHQSRDGIALIEIHGTIFNRMMAAISGMTSPQAITKAVRAAADSRDIKEILISMDSPGGVALNIDEAAAAVRYASSLKPTKVIVNGYMASAAYWIGSGASEIVTTPLSAVGSIGVITSHADYSKLYEEAGIDIEIYRTGEQKALGQPTDPNDKKFKQSIMAELNQILGVFAADVAKGRGLSVEDVLNRFALNSDLEGALKGSTVLGAEAVTIGLADRVTSSLNVEIEAAVSRLSKSSRRKNPYARLRKDSMDIDKIMAMLEDENATPEQIKDALAKLEGEAKAAGEAEGVTAFKASDEYKKLEASASDGKAYRDSLLERLAKATITIDAKGADSEQVAERAKRIYGSASMEDLKAEVDRLEAQIAASLPSSREYTETEGEPVAATSYEV